MLQSDNVVQGKAMSILPGPSNAYVRALAQAV